MIDEWIRNHQLLTISLGVPIFSAFIAAIASTYATKRTIEQSKLERYFQSNLKLADFRQCWINNMLDDLSEFGALCTFVSKHPQKLESFQRMAFLQNRIHMRMNPKDPDYADLQKAIWDELSNATREDGEEPKEISETSGIVGRRILKREWDRLKMELNKTT